MKLKHSVLSLVICLLVMSVVFVFTITAPLLWPIGRLIFFGLFLVVWMLILQTDGSNLLKAGLLLMAPILLGCIAGLLIQISRLITPEIARYIKDEGGVQSIIGMIAGFLLLPEMILIPAGIIDKFEMLRKGKKG